MFHFAGSVSLMFVSSVSVSLMFVSCSSATGDFGDFASIPAATSLAPQPAAVPTAAPQSNVDLLADLAMPAMPSLQPVGQQMMASPQQGMPSLQPVNPMMPPQQVMMMSQQPTMAGMPPQGMMGMPNMQQMPMMGMSPMGMQVSEGVC